jgi:hypothetical protein
MFREPEYFLGGESARVVLTTVPGSETLMRNAFPLINSVDVLLRLQEQFPEAWEICADTPIPVAVSFAEEIEQLTGRTMYDVSGIAEHHEDGGAVISLSVRSDSEPRDVVEVIKHELAHANDIATGRLRIDAASLKITWEGEVYEGIALPALDVEAMRRDARAKALAIVAFAKYFSQPWELSANEGLWGKEFKHVRELVATHGTTWKPEWNAYEEEIVSTMSNFKVSLHEAVRFLLER